jgi:beta-glucosidase
MLLRLFVGVLVVSAVVLQNPEALPYKQRDLPIDARVRDLLGRMTLEEKFWQLFMIPGDLDNAANDYSKGIFGLQIRNAPTARAHAERINAIQRFFVEKTRLGIPIIPFEEAVHGVTMEGATMFPAAIGLAASWDTTLMATVADVIARESRSRGIRQVLSPVIKRGGRRPRQLSDPAQRTSAG